MKEYKNNGELIDYLISKNVIVNDRELALKNIEKYYILLTHLHTQIFSFYYNKPRKNEF